MVAAFSSLVIVQRTPYTVLRQPLGSFGAPGSPSHAAQSVSARTAGIRSVGSGAISLLAGTVTITHARNLPGGSGIGKSCQIYATPIAAKSPGVIVLDSRPSNVGRLIECPHDDNAALAGVKRRRKRGEVVDCLAPRVNMLRGFPIPPRVSGTNYTGPTRNDKLTRQLFR